MILARFSLIQGCGVKNAGARVQNYLSSPSYYSRATSIGVHLSQCERQAGHPQGVALLYTRRSCRLWSRVSRRATPCGWPVRGGVGGLSVAASVACPALARASGNASGATPGGWPVRAAPDHGFTLWGHPLRLAFGRRGQVQCFTIGTVLTMKLLTWAKRLCVTV